MNATNITSSWEEYRDQELVLVSNILSTLGYTLDEKQVHTAGERSLMTGERDVGGGGLKLVLTGKSDVDDKRVVIKTSSDPAGQQEIRRERDARIRINAIPFAYHSFNTPQELYFGTHGSHIISIVEYVSQEKPLLMRPLEEQFFLTLKALEAQEGAHAAASSHTEHTAELGAKSADEYIHDFSGFCSVIRDKNINDPELHKVLDQALAFLKEHRTTIERYCGFLTHADFVPNNFRVRDNELYLLDYASIHFGNKYEGWARLLNFMVHHNPDLEHALIDYIRTNRSADEYLSLRLMRIYKLGFLLKYHSLTHNSGSSNMRTLAEARIVFWTEVLKSVLTDTLVSQNIIDIYMQTSRALRSEEERARQVEMVGRG